MYCTVHCLIYILNNVLSSGTSRSGSRPSCSTTVNSYIPPGSVAKSFLTSSCKQNKASASNVPNSLIRSHGSLNMPDYDESAKKKIKFMNENDNNINVIGSKILETLDHVNRKMTNPKETSKEPTVDDRSKMDYKNHLTLAVQKIPSGYEDECMEHILQELQIFDEQNTENQNI